MSKIVSKFGGSSMKDAQAMKKAAAIVADRGSSIVVVSATYGTTDQLVELIKVAETGNQSKSDLIVQKIKDRHFSLLKEAGLETTHLIELKKLLNALETLSQGINLLKECSPMAKDEVLSLGERLSSLLFSGIVANELTKKNISLLDAREVIATDQTHQKGKPQINLIRKYAQEKIKLGENDITITQGFIGKGPQGRTTTLGRGGSDYSAALFAEAIQADTLEIWTDVAGIASTDPRICDNVVAISEISYDEASEMAQYGAKILHPTTLVPAMREDIPVFVGSTYHKEAKGTWIRKEVNERPLIRAITQRKDQSLLTIRTPKMLNAIGFMQAIFSAFTRHNVSIDCVTTSEISVAISVDAELANNKNLMEELTTLGEVQLEQGYSLISLIGNNILTTSGIGGRVFKSLEGINVRMLCIGASEYNMNVLVKDEDAMASVQNLHQEFIGLDHENSVAWKR